MRIDPGVLVASISSLADTQPQQDLAGTLQQVVDAAKLLFRAKGAGVMLADEHGELRWVAASDQQAQLAEDNQELLGRGPCMVAFSQRVPAVISDARHEPEWGEITLLFSDVQIEAAASVPIELTGGPIGTLDVYAGEPREWDPSEVSALQAFAGVVASLLASAAQAQVKGRLAEQLEVALESRVLIEQAKGALMVRQDIDEATAFEWLRLSARSSSRTVTAVAEEILAGHWPPMPQLAEVVGRLAQARRYQQRTHQQAIELHEQAADQHDRLGQDKLARAEHDRADDARKRLQQARDEEAESGQEPAKQHRASASHRLAGGCGQGRSAGITIAAPEQPGSRPKGSLGRSMQAAGSRPTCPRERVRSRGAPARGCLVELTAGINLEPTPAFGCLSDWKAETRWCCGLLAPGVL